MDNEFEKVSFPLKQLEIIYRSIFEAAPDGVMILNGETGKIEITNPYIQDLLGYKKEELLGKQIWQISPIKNIIANKSQFRKLQKEKIVRYENLPLESKKGIAVEVEFINSLYKVDGIKTIQCRIREISERKIKERDLAQYNLKKDKIRLSLIESVFVSTDDGILIIDRFGKVVSYNEQFLKLWKIPKQLANKKNDKILLDFVVEQLSNPKEFMKKVEYLYDHPKEKSRDDVYFIDGRIFERYSVPQIMENEIIGRVWNFRDVTESRQVDMFLKESEKKYRTLVENAKDMIYSVDENGIILSVNKASIKVIGLSKKNIIGKHLRKIFDKDTANRFLKTIKYSIKKNKSIDKISKMIIGDKEFWIQASISPIISNGNKKYVIGISKNITNLQKTQEALKKANANLKKIDEIRYLMLRDVAHELKTPSSIIKMTSSALLDEFKKSDFDKIKVLDFLEIIARNADHFNKQIGAMVELSRYGNIKQIKNKKIAIYEIVEKVHQEYQLLSESRKLRFDLEIKGSPEVLGNKNLLERMIKNLVDNAFKYTKKGFVVLRCFSSGKNVIISVKDSGIGMQKKYIKNLFKPFTKIDPSTEGMGVGLATVEQIVKLYKGQVKVQSVPGKGSIFKIYLPKK